MPDRTAFRRCRNPACECTLNEFDAKRPDGLCLRCGNAGVGELLAELDRLRAKQRELHRRTQRAESDENDRVTPLRNALRSHEFSRNFAIETMEKNRVDATWCSELQRQLYRVLLDGKREAEAERDRLAGQLRECWALLKLTAAGVAVGPGAGRLLRSHGQPGE